MVKTHIKVLYSQVSQCDFRKIEVYLLHRLLTPTPVACEYSFVFNVGSLILQWCMLVVWGVFVPALLQPMTTYDT